MPKVLMTAAVSLDGFIAYEDNTVGRLFDWYGNGGVATHLGDESRVFHVSRASADYLDAVRERITSGVIGRRLFDFTNGWNGVPAAGEHAVVLTHEPPSDWEFAATAPFHFVTEGVKAAVALAKELAGDGDVSITAGDVGSQALAAGLVDEVHLNLVPVTLGSGRRFFGAGVGEHVLENPRVIEGDRVVHLVYEISPSRAAG